MSLHRMAERVNREQGEAFGRMAEEMGLLDPRLDREGPDPDAPGAGPETAPPGPSVPLAEEPAAPVLAEPAPPPAPEVGAVPPAGPPEATPEPTLIEDPAEPASSAPAPVVPVAPAAPMTPQPGPTSQADPPPPSEGDEAEVSVPALPAGVPAGSTALLLSDEDRAAAIAAIKIQGSVVDGGPAEDLLNGKHPRPSVASQREISQLNRLRLGGIDIARPINWPEFMTYPTDLELRELTRGELTPERVRQFEQAKQVQADLMEARAKEINDWIFTYGTMALNERAQMRRARNRDAALRKRSIGPGGERIADQEVDRDVTDEELYRDRFYGIRFALLLNPDPDHLNRLKAAPVAAWGHDQLRTMDGGRIQARGDELVVRSVSLQAAQLLVMEARARGWETLRVSGDNEFCAAVKRAAKEAGMGAIIHRRGPLGIGPFSRPEVIMPALPRGLPPQTPDPTEPERKRREEGAPAADRAAADLLLTDGPRPRSGPERGRERPSPDAVRVEDPTRPAAPAPDGPSGPEPV